METYEIFHLAYIHAPVIPDWYVHVADPEPENPYNENMLMLDTQEKEMYFDALERGHINVNLATPKLKLAWDKYKNYQKALVDYRKKDAASRYWQWRMHFASYCSKIQAPDFLG